VLTVQHHGREYQRPSHDVRTMNRRARFPVRLYLDSSDYSVLSDPVRAAREAPGVLDQLRRHIEAGELECFFSAAHLTEMAPVAPRYSDAALRRADMLIELCGRNAMIHIERLFDSEVKAALRIATPVRDPIDREGGWFPVGIAEMSPVTAADEVRYAVDAIKDALPMSSRAQRRQAKRMLVKSGQLRPPVKHAIKASAQEGDLSAILKIYPMRPEDARVLVRYIAGDATPEEATHAFESSLRDPRWMMRWFEQHHENLSPFVAWARGPAAEVTASVMALARLVDAARSNPLLTEDVRAALYGPAKWRAMESRMVLGLANRFAAKLGDKYTVDEDAIGNECPGLSTAIRALYSAWRSITFEQQRSPKPSDVVDALHASYAPYVDLFRADVFMSQYIAPHVKQFGTVVIPKLSELPSAVIARLDQAR
jgi:hypothetical protein